MRDLLRTCSRDFGPGSRRLFALCAATLLPAAIGCGSTPGGDGGDAVEVAVTINKNLERGQKLMDAARADWNMHDPAENESGLNKLLEAEELFFEARKLSPNSSKPRIALGNCRSLIGYVYYSQYEKFEGQRLAAVESGDSPPRRVVERRDEARTAAEEWLGKANRELEFYVRFLIGQFPNPFVYEQLATNYEYLGQYGAAEQMLRVFMQNVQLTGARRKEFEARAKALREKRLDEFEG